jgi:hypothetical protein
MEQFCCILRCQALFPLIIGSIKCAGTKCKDTCRKNKIFLNLPTATLHAGFLDCPPWPRTDVTLTAARWSVKEKEDSTKKFSNFYKVNKSKFLSVLEILLKFCQTLLFKNQC